MKDKKHLFFDLDRTLWDFDTNSREALQELFDEKKLTHEVGEFDHFLSVYQKVNEQCWGYYRMGSLKKEILRVKRFKDTFIELGYHNDSIVRFFSDEYVKRSPNKKNLLPGTSKVLEYLAGKGYVLHIITNGFKEIQHLKLKNSSIDIYFDTVLCSEETGAKKPHPKVFLTALEMAKTQAENSVMIGDDWEADVMGGKKSGLHPLWFNPEKIEKKDDSVDHFHHLEDLLRVF